MAKAESDLQGILQMLIDLHYRSLITASVAIVWSGEDGHHVPILAPIVSLHDKLMCARHQCEAIVVVECLGDILTESISCATRADAPSAAIVGVRPQQIAHGTFVGYFLYSVEAADVVEGVDAGGETAVEAENLVIDQCREGQVVKKVGEVFPDISIAIFAQALIVEAVNLGNLAGFVIAAEDGDALGVADFEGDEEGDSFDRVVAAVYIIAFLSLARAGELT